MANEIQIYDNKALIGVADDYLNHEAKGIVLPPNYDYRNAVSMLYLQCVSATTADGQPVLEACTPDSIKRTVQEMVSKGLNPAKKQCYAIPYAVKDKDTKQIIRYELQLQESYFGKIKRVYDENPDVVRNSIHAQCIYEGDDFQFEIVNGRRVITKHVQKFENISDANIIGAYATVQFKDGTTKSEIMTTAEIKKSWAMSRAGGAVHANFTHEMCCKTVESRLAKHLSNSTDDGGSMGFYEGESSIPDDVINVDDIEDAESTELLPGTPDDMSEVVSEEPAPQVEVPVEAEYICSKCGKKISKKAYDYSVKNCGKPLCFKCQSSEGDNE